MLDSTEHTICVRGKGTGMCHGHKIIVQNFFDGSESYQHRRSSERPSNKDPAYNKLIRLVSDTSKIPHLPQDPPWYGMH